MMNWLLDKTHPSYKLTTFSEHKNISSFYFLYSCFKNFLIRYLLEIVKKEKK